MKRYSFFHGLVLSFFSKSFYRDVAQYWRGTGLAYMLLILAIFWIPTAIKMYSGFKKFVDNDSASFTKQIPAITIKNGQVSTDVATPYFINDEDGTPVAIIDTTGQYKTLDDTSARILVTKNKAVVKGTADTRIYDLSNVQSFYVDRARVEGWFAIAKKWFIPMFYPMALLFSFIFRAIQILIYALIGLAFANMLHVKLEYKTLMRLAAVALTPVLVLDLVLEFVPLRIPLWSVLGVLIGLGYLFFAIKSNAEPETIAPVYAPGAPPV